MRYTPRGPRFKAKIHPYASKAHPDVVSALVESAEEMGASYRRGVTVSNSGFFANQGRQVSRNTHHCVRTLMCTPIKTEHRY
ncbi:MAG: hypothetical protein Q9N34_06040 [Aquificota bacterium]|nr:hypothetical protein [Aquificota bacterium]